MQKRVHFLAIFALVILSASCGERSVLDRYVFGRDVIVLSSDRGIESNPGLYAEVQRDGEIIVPETFIGPFQKNFNYRTLGTSEIFGLVDSGEPFGVLFLYESLSAASWPHRKGDESTALARQRGQLLLGKLKTSLNNDHFFLKE